MSAPIRSGRSEETALPEVTEMILGNVNEQSLEEIWNGETYRKFRSMHVTGQFPKGHKCNERCDQKKLYQYLK